MASLRSPTRVAPARCVVAQRRANVLARNATPTVQITVKTKEGNPLELSCESGDQLRAVLMANKVDLYTTWGKVWQCGGVGNCGTCIVEVRLRQGLISVLLSCTQCLIWAKSVNSVCTWTGNAS